MPLPALQAAVDDLVRDRDGVITTEDRDQAIGSALLRYFEDRPRVLVEDLASAGDRTLPLPAGWVPGSVVRAAEYPVGHIPARLLQPGSVTTYQDPDGEVLVLPVAVPLGELVRISYTTVHQVEAVVDTVPEQHRQAVASLAASILCGQLASYYSTDSDPTIGADTVDHRTKSDRWRSRERDLRSAYFRDVGVRENRSAPASAVAQWNTRNVHGGARIFHPPREPLG